ncbi:hypothetical protein MLD38_002206 [Melastoma candidum]|uniref:Uncharacterized protein n=1 Tax=Melastoma candidum TaxID=119954 RepID=A0ACB9SG44_9MYRT|nr:hypothetical protein MLD38_002206 [Melastoma candidum]
MQKMAQSWFSASPDEQQKPSSSLLSDWNSYAASQDSDSSAGGSAFSVGFDIESAVRSANDSVSGTFNVVTKGVRDLPGSLQSATSGVPSGKSLMYFGLLLASGIFFVIIAFTMFLPVMGPKNQLVHMTSTERLPFTAICFGSMVGTIYVSMVLHSYIFSLLFSIIQVLALVYYVISYFPGGSTGLKFLTSSLTSTIMGCFGR